ncbi:MAG TPA: hypothetical protein VLD59_08175 [Steroidobacteraceae bacterium]|nr:hypothetical protein [Steroidobacteraceae bacterium]
MSNAENKVQGEPAESVTAYKAFNLDWTCRGFQYEVGKTFSTDAEVVRCASGGFHSCENPLDTFKYYKPGKSRFALVKASGKIARDTEDTKIASASISIEAELTIPQIVTAAIAWIAALCVRDNAKHSEGYNSASSATVYRSASSATVYRSASSATGDSSASSATGDSSASSATGYSSASSATGDRSASSATGNRSASSATGIGAVALNTGWHGKARASKGGAIVICNHDEDGNLRHIFASKVGENNIKPDVFYSLDDDGLPVEEEIAS